MASLVAQMVKNLPAVWETWVQSLGWEDPLEDDMATHSSILAWRIPMDRRGWWATVHGVTESDMTEQLSTAQPILGLFTKRREIYLLSIEKSLNEAGLFILSPYCKGSD